MINVSIQTSMTLGSDLVEFEHQGRTYVVGVEGERYQIKIKNLTAGRIKVITTVDGRDVITGKPGSPSASSGYVIDGNGVITISGFRQTDENVAAFRFAARDESYASKMGAPENVGVIGVAAFFEKRAPLAMMLGRSEGRALREHRAQALGRTRGMAKSGGQHVNKATRSLGTAYGETIASGVRKVSFEQASLKPDQVVTIYYDSLESLRARGIVADGPNPFPASPVVTPGYAEPPPE